tara:strand:- start:269 stop:379 length:111 start_codon:yes stop_codon:yes gene_type:complete
MGWGIFKASIAVFARLVCAAALKKIRGQLREMQAWL